MSARVASALRRLVRGARDVVVVTLDMAPLFVEILRTASESYLSGRRGTPVHAAHRGDDQQIEVDPMGERIRTIVAAAAAATLCIGLAACSSADSTPEPAGSSAQPGVPVAGGSLTVVIPDAIDGWNPATALQISTYQLIREVTAPLLELSPDGTEVVPGLASAWDYDSTRTHLTLTIDPEAAFSDGTPVMAKDVVFSVEQWMAGESYGPLYSSIIKQAKPAGDKKVVLTLTAPSSALVPILTWSTSAVLPADFGGKSKDAFFAKPIGAGPYAIESESPGDSITLVRNEHFHVGGQPYLDSLTYRVVTDTSQRLVQVASGDAGLADRVPLDSLSTVTGDPQVVKVPSSTLSLVIFNHATGPTKDAHFRRAFSLALDRSGLVSGVYAGDATVATGVLPAVIPGAEGCPTCDWSTYDAAAAKTELASSGYSGDPVDLLVDSSRGVDLLAAQAVVPMLEAAGISARIQQVDSATFLTRLSTGDYTAAIGNYSAMAPTAVDPLSFVAATAFLFSGADVTPAMTAIGGVSAADTTAGQAAAVAPFEQDVYDTTAVAPLLSPAVAAVAAPNVHGLELLPSGLYDAARLWVLPSP
jgi:ABC-type transport system substrate-binding protein